MTEPTEQDLHSIQPYMYSAAMRLAHSYSYMYELQRTVRSHGSSRKASQQRRQRRQQRRRRGGSWRRGIAHRIDIADCWLQLQPAATFAAAAGTSCKPQARENLSSSRPARMA
eukprot:COSAG01_NODE_2122_length_8373_cov_4.387962_10_plen_113_part_00